MSSVPRTMPGKWQMLNKYLLNVENAGCDQIISPRHPLKPKPRELSVNEWVCAKNACTGEAQILCLAKEFMWILSGSHTNLL